jgi:hypothetical protein
MRFKDNYVRLGPVAVKVSSKHLAPWGYPRLQIGGLSLWSWWNDGDFCPASYHPQSSITWLWQTKLHCHGRNPPYQYNSSGGRDIRLGFGWVLSVMWQDRMPRDQPVQ